MIYARNRPTITSEPPFMYRQTVRVRHTLVRSELFARLCAIRFETVID